jgi:type IV pilus assembly protein PilQ
VFTTNIYPVTNINLNNNKNKDGKLQELRTRLKGYNRKITIRFKDTNITAILKYFSQEFNFNIMTAPTVKGPVSFSFKRLDGIIAFDSVLNTYGYTWTLKKNMIYISTENPVKIFALNYATVNDVSVTIKKLLTRNDVLSIDKRTNSLIVKAPSNVLRKVEALLKELDRIPRQVLVEVKIMEVHDDYASALGVDLSYNKSGIEAKSQGLSTLTKSPDTGLFVQVLKGDFAAKLEGLITKDALDILARPKILTLNHRKATLETGQKLGYKTSVSSATTGVIGEQVNFLEVGTKLSFTPHITDNEDILMEISPEISEGTISAEGLPNETNTKTNTYVMVKNNQTILIGGLIRKKKTKTDRGVPILSSIPFIDHFFKHSEVTTQKVETIVLITPKIVQPGEMIEELTSPNVELIKLDNNK